MLGEGIEFADNPDPRCPCVLLLDTSGSMSGQPISLLNDGLRAFQADICTDELAKRRSEIAVVTFGSSGVQVYSFDTGSASAGQGSKYFVTAGHFQAPMLAASGVTPMGEAIQRGLDLIRERKEQYKRFGITYYRPWMFLITDGEPTDQWQSAATRLRSEVSQSGLVFFAVGVPPQANLSILSQIAPVERPPVMLDSLRFTDMFLWLSRSQQRVSASKPGEQVSLPPVGWTSVAT